MNKNHSNDTFNTWMCPKCKFLVTDKILECTTRNCTGRKQRQCNVSSGWIFDGEHRAVVHADEKKEFTPFWDKPIKYYNFQRAKNAHDNSIVSLPDLEEPKNPESSNVDRLLYKIKVRVMDPGVDSRTKEEHRKLYHHFQKILFCIRQLEHRFGYRDSIFTTRAKKRGGGKGDGRTFVIETKYDEWSPPPTHGAVDTYVTFICSPNLVLHLQHHPKQGVDHVHASEAVESNGKQDKDWKRTTICEVESMENDVR